VAASPMPRPPSSFRPVALAGDLAIAAVSLYLAFLIRTHVALPGTGGLLPPDRIRLYPGNLVLFGGAQAFFLSLFGLYDPRERFRDPLARVLLPALFAELLTLSSLYFLAFAQGYAFPRSVLLVYIAIDGVLLAAWRALLDRIFPQPPAGLRPPRLSPGRAGGRCPAPPPLGLSPPPPEPAAPPGPVSRSWGWWGRGGGRSPAAATCRCSAPWRRCRACSSNPRSTRS